MTALLDKTVLVQSFVSAALHIRDLKRLTIQRIQHARKL
jgi:hypothetical protein